MGDVIEGKIIGKESSCLFIDLAPQGIGVIRGREFHEARGRIKDLTTGKKIFAKVISPETDEGYIELSLKDAQKEIVWQELEQKKEEKESLTVKILGANKGGLLTNVNGVPAFLPVSQLSNKNYPKVEEGNPQKILKKLQDFIGKELQVNIFSLDQKQNQIILSERLKETEEKKEILKKYQVEDVVEGEITAICDFGTFVKFPLNKKEEEKVEGLIHISELDWQLVEDPAKVVKIGEKVKAKILQITGDKVFLSLKALKENPWQDIEKKLKKGDIIKGKVKKLNPYGAFVEVLPKIQGLCHISEFGSQKKMEETLKVNESYNFKILLIDPAEYKVTLEFVDKVNPVSV